MGRWVAALGGNAILKPGQTGTTSEQWKNVRLAVDQLVMILEDGHELIVTHGNGPQVGILLQQQNAMPESIPPWTLDLCGALTQGLLGFMLQHALNERLAQLGLPLSACAIVTEVVVDPKDPAFDDPTKPVGTFVGREEAEARRKLGEFWEEDAGRGWRRVVPSPQPQRVTNLDAIRLLSDSGNIVIAAGGGGIPVVADSLKPIEAVIDKDLTSALLALALDADGLLILTDVSQVYINYKQAGQVAIAAMSVAEAQEYYAAGHFSKGSMGPKVLAGIEMAKHGKPAIIAQLNDGAAALKGQKGTRINPSQD